MQPARCPPRSSAFSWYCSIKREGKLHWRKDKKNTLRRKENAWVCFAASNLLIDLPDSRPSKPRTWHAPRPVMVCTFQHNLPMEKLVTLQKPLVLWLKDLLTHHISAAESDWTPASDLNCIMCRCWAWPPLTSTSNRRTWYLKQGCRSKLIGVDLSAFLLMACSVEEKRKAG